MVSCTQTHKESKNYFETRDTSSMPSIASSNDICTTLAQQGMLHSCCDCGITGLKDPSN